MNFTERRYDLDWLRVLSILAVYIHHILMPFNGDEFHIMNSDSSKTLDDIMVYFEQFRLPLLFLISGTGTMFAFRKRSWIQFIKERSKRLLIPLIFGVLFIVPPQAYYENKTEFKSFFDIYKNFTFDANHLWFIENLFLMSMGLLPFILFLRSNKSNKVIVYIEKIASKKLGFVLLVIPLIIVTIILKKYDPSDSKDITNLSSTFFYGYFFAFGMLFTSSSKIWEYLIQYRKLNLTVLLFSSVLFYAYYFIPNEWINPYLSISTRWNIWYFVCCLVSWVFIITLLGYSQTWWNTKSVLLTKCNEAIYPFYILHQTIIIIVGYYILQLNLNIPYKIGTLLVVTFPIIVLIYRYLVYPFKILRILFGMKNKQNSSS